MYGSRLAVAVSIVAILVPHALFVAVVEAAPLCFGRQPTIVGTPGDDVLRGTSGNDVIVGRGGDDTIKGLRGDDRLCGGAGDEYFEADALISGVRVATASRGDRVRTASSVEPARISCAAAKGATISRETRAEMCCAVAPAMTSPGRRHSVCSEVPGATAYWGEVATTSSSATSRYPGGRNPATTSCWAAAVRTAWSGVSVPTP